MSEYISKKNLNRILGWWIADCPYGKCIQVTPNMELGLNGDWHENGPPHFVMVSDTECETTIYGNYCTVYKNIEDCKECIVKHLEKDIPYYEHQANNQSPPKEVFAWIERTKHSTWYMQEFMKKFEREREYAKNHLMDIQEMIRNVREFGESKYSEIYDRRSADSSERHKREYMERIRLGAYFIAEKDGFCKHPDEYWHQAEYQYLNG